MYLGLSILPTFALHNAVTCVNNIPNFLSAECEKCTAFNGFLLSSCFDFIALLDVSSVSVWNRIFQHRLVVLWKYILLNNFLTFHSPLSPFCFPYSFFFLSFLLFSATVKVFQGCMALKKRSE